MKKVWGWYVTEKSKLPKQIHKRLGPIKLDDPNPLALGSIYSWMKSLENSLLIPAPSTSHAGQETARQQSGISQNTMTVNYHHRGVPLEASLHRAVNKLAARISDRPEERKLVENMFTEAHKFIDGRQCEVADELLAWRDAQVARWEKVLKERELAEVVNGVTPPDNSSSSECIAAQKQTKQQRARTVG
jgi:hypothetical protein